MSQSIAQDSLGRSRPPGQTNGLKPPWQPGQSGNALGVHRGFRRVLSMARKGSPEAVQTILDCMRDQDAPWSVRLTAATWVVERAWGKAQERVSIDGADGMNITIITGVPRNGDDAPVANETTYTIEYDVADDVPNVSHETKE